MSGRVGPSWVHRPMRMRLRGLQAEELESPAVVPGDPAQTCGDAVEPVEAKDRDREVAQRREHLGCTADAYLGAVLVKDAVAHVVTAVLDPPVAANGPG